jgi:hypothetical protein
MTETRSNPCENNPLTENPSNVDISNDPDGYIEPPALQLERMAREAGNDYEALVEQYKKSDEIYPGTEVDEAYLRYLGILSEAQETGANVDALIDHWRTRAAEVIRIKNRRVEESGSY